MATDVLRQLPRELTGPPSRPQATASFDDRVVEIGVRHEADHRSASPRQHLLARAFQLLLERRRKGRLRLDGLLLNASAFCHVPFDLFSFAR